MIKHLGQQVGQQIEKILESESTLLSEHVPTKKSPSVADIKKHYECSNELYLIKNIPLSFSNGVNENNIQNFLDQLSIFFEVGLFLRHNERYEKHHVENGFGFGQKLPVDLSEKFMKIPKTAHFAVLKTQAEAILERMDLAYFDSRRRMTAYLVGLSKTSAVILLTETAEPWLELKLQTLQEALMGIDFDI